MCVGGERGGFNNGKNFKRLSSCIDRGESKD